MYKNGTVIKQCNLELSSFLEQKNLNIKVAFISIFEHKKFIFNFFNFHCKIPQTFLWVLILLLSTLVLIATFYGFVHFITIFHSNNYLNWLSCAFSLAISSSHSFTIRGSHSIISFIVPATRILLSAIATIYLILKIVIKIN